MPWGYLLELIQPMEIAETRQVGESEWMVTISMPFRMKDHGGFLRVLTMGEKPQAEEGS